MRIEDMSAGCWLIKDLGDSMNIELNMLNSQMISGLCKSQCLKRGESTPNLLE